MHKKSKKNISICTVTSVLLTSSLTSVKVSAATPPESPRLWGADRYETAVKISQAGWTSSEYAVIASGEGYADALCAAPLAKANNAPVLLTKKNELNEKTLKELKRLGVKHIYIIGGQGSVSNEVEKKIKTLVTSDITRLAGRDRYETSVKIAEKLGKSDKIMLASGEGYADALSAVPVAAIKGMPILLTKANELPGSTKEYLKASGATTTYVIGGTASINDTVKGLVPGSERIYGQDRYETNAAIMNAFATEFDFHKAYVALGSGNKNEFADALAGSALAAKDGAPVIITGKTLSDATKEAAKEKLSPTSTITVLGGVANVPDELVNSIKVTAVEYFDKEGTNYTKVVNGNAVAVAKDVKLSDTTVKGNLYIEGNNISVTNSTVEGTVYINPGKDGVATLDGVTADKIVVLSGAKDSIHLKYVKANLLNVISRENVRIVAASGTAIKNSAVLSNAILEGNGGSFGEMKLPKTTVEKSVELRGNIDKPVIVEGKANLKAASGATVVKVQIRSDKNDKVVLGGNLGTVEVYTPANIVVETGAKATIKAVTPEAKASAKIEVPKGTEVKTDGFNEGAVTGEGAKDAVTPPAGGGGGGFGGGGSVEVYDPLATKIEDTIKMYTNFKTNSGNKNLPDVKYLNKTIYVDINKSKENDTLSATFNNKKDNLTVNRLATIESIFGSIMVGDKSLPNYVASRSMFSNYYDGTNILNDKIVDRLKQIDSTYVVDRAKAIIESKTATTVPTMKINDLTIVQVAKGSTVVELEGKTYGNLKDKFDEIFGTDYENITYGNLAGTYSVTLKNSSGKTVTYNLVITLK